ncbi:glycosyltransferase [Niabella ginsenosidivorans]|nr:glycosyltransferase [Niabella ginsenosidivorans]
MPEQITGKEAMDDAPTFSVIIPARNEATTILPLLESIKKQSYLLEYVEIIVIDDHSEDHTAALVQKFRAENQGRLTVRLISLKEDALNSYKKKAIETGIAAAKKEWIVCTDADCTVPVQWLQSYAERIRKAGPVFIAAPVSLIPTPTSVKKHRLLYIFQTLDFLTLQGITGASVYKNVHTMCNGANLAYKRDTFYEVNGFKGIDTIASGDDMLLMHKIWKRHPQKIQYLKSKEAIVETAAAATWRAFINQRIRWASKATRYEDKRIFGVLLLVYLFNCSFLLLLVMSFFNVCYFYAFFWFWIAKTFTELPFITSVASFFDKRQLLRYFFIFQPLHIGYTILAGFLGSFGKYEWKGRVVK